MNNFLMYSRGVNPHENLALETALMERIRPGDMCLYLWQNRHTVVIGRNQNAWKECRCELLKEEGGTLARRSSGGGAVYHDLGNLNFTFAASPERYDLAGQLDMIIGALKEAGIHAEATGRNDMTVEGRKFSGNAFKYAKTCSMQHGTLLIKADMDKMSRYLRPSESKLRAKGVDSVRSRVCNLSEYNSSLTIERMKTLMAEAFVKKFGGADVIDSSELDISGILPRYSSWEWNYGETPKFDVSLERRFAWGGVEILISLKKGVVEGAEVYTDALDTEISEKIKNSILGASYDGTLPERLEFFPDVAQWMREELPM